MRIERITAVQAQVPYEAPVGPYIGRGGPPGSLGGAGLIVKIETSSALVGWGEGVGQFERDPTALLKGRHAADIEGAMQCLAGAGLGPGPRSGIEMALWDLLGKKAELPLCLLWGGLVRQRVEFTACMGLKEPDQSAATARTYIDKWGFANIKTKAGIDPEQDLAIAAAVQREIGTEAAFRPDANGGYEPALAEEQMRKMQALGVRFFEDPCSVEHAEILARIRRQTSVKVLVNMGVQGPQSAATILAKGAADMLMPDTPAAGGLATVRQVAAVAAGSGVECLMHCSHDLGLKTAAICQVAAATANFSGPNDTCYHGLVDDILTEKLHFEAGCLAVPLEPGLGVQVDEAKLEKYRV